MSCAILFTVNSIEATLQEIGWIVISEMSSEAINVDKTSPCARVSKDIHSTACALPIGYKTAQGLSKGIKIFIKPLIVNFKIMCT